MRYEAISKFIAFIQDKVTEFVNLDLQKKLLSYHASFESMEVFRALDKDNNGYLTAEEFSNYFSDDVDLTNDVDFAAVIKFWSNTKDEGKLNYNDF